MPLTSKQDEVEEPAVGRFRTLYQLLAALSKATALPEVFEAAITSLLDATGAHRAAILLFDDAGVLRFEASRGLSREYQEAVAGHSPWRPGQLDAQPIMVPDTLMDGNLAKYRDAFKLEGIRALGFIPLALADGVFGKFMLYYDAPHQFNAEELEIAQVIAAHVALAADRKRAEIARDRSERRLQAILDNTAAVIFLKDLEGRYLLVNRRLEQLFQADRRTILGRTDYEVFPDEAEQFRSHDQAVLEAGKPMAIEETVRQQDGVHTFVALKFPLQEPDGTVTGICGIATDITERKLLEAASRHLAAIVEDSDDAIISKDLNGLITSWNRGAERLFGYTAEELVGKPIAILAAPDHRDEMPVILSKIRAGQRVEHYETRRRRKDGEIIDVALTISPVRDDSGQVIGASKIARDITERKAIEQEHLLLLAREQDARRTAELLNQVAPRLVAELDVETLVQAITDIATTLVGAEFGAFFYKLINEKGESYTLYTLSGAPREAFAGFPMPRDTEMFAPTFHGEGVVRCADVTKDHRYGRNLPNHGMPKGHLPVRSYLAAPVVSRSKEVLGGLFFGHVETGRFTATHEEILKGIAAQAAIAMDNARLFEQGQWAQAALKRSNEEFRRANRDLEVFAYSASHDLQEPLRNIAISAQIIERRFGKQLEGEDSEVLAEILASAKRMSSLLEDLLAYTQATKYEHGSALTVDPAAVLADVLESLRVPIQETGAVITAGKLPAAEIHEGRLAQLFQNLIGNAIKYCNKEVPLVHITAEQRDGWIVFSVADNGIGIESQYAEQIFGLFKRLHSRSKYPGSGIGLAICQRLVEHYGGRIWLERSEPDRGSTFCFSIPARV
jgi:PAS domain S-box-containing protein